MARGNGASLSHQSRLISFPDNSQHIAVIVVHDERTFDVAMSDPLADWQANCGVFTG